MQLVLERIFLFAFVSVPLQQAAAAACPTSRVSAKNAVPECVTPGRLIEYLKSRNPELSSPLRERARRVHAHRRAARRALGLRLLPDDPGDRRAQLPARQPVGRREARAEQLCGPRRHRRRRARRELQGRRRRACARTSSICCTIPAQKLDNPTAERTRKVQEWGVLTNWHAQFTRPITFADLAAKWAPGSNSYSQMLEAIAERFDEFCDKPDPRPELVAQVRGSTQGCRGQARAPVRRRARQARHRDGKAEDGAQQVRPWRARTIRPAAKARPAPYKILNAPPPSQETADPGRRPTRRHDRCRNSRRSQSHRPRPARSRRQAAKACSRPPAKRCRPRPARSPAATGTAEKRALPGRLGSRRRQADGAAAGRRHAGQKCRVWTASYGGQKALIIRSVIDKVVNYTVLDVNEGAEKREADAFISAYAKDGAIAGEYGNQSQALDKAFELCPEG